MKKACFLLLAAGITLLSCSDQHKKEKKGLDTSLINNPRTADGSASTDGLATMDFVDTMHDFGSMHEGEKASYEFRFKNNGKAPLLIANAAGTCGCTVPDYPHQPIQPGEEGIINVRFNSAGKTGSQHKSVNIFTNSNKGKHVLNITAEVADQ
jgi:hypothetical protein